jgi:hypothetical protein
MPRVSNLFPLKFPTSRYKKREGEIAKEIPDRLSPSQDLPVRD